jgi:integrase
MAYWLEHIAEPSIRRTSYATYEGDLRLHIVPGSGKRKLKTLQASDIRLWLNQLRARCRCCAQGKDARRRPPRCCAKAEPECCQDLLSSSSVRHVLGVLRAAQQDAVDEELLSRNVARLVQLRVTDDRKVRSFTRTEAMRFLKAAEQQRLYALWAVALAMGLRRGEALGLAWADVDLDNGRLTVRQALHRVDGELRLDRVKTDASVAVLPIPVPLVSILLGHRSRQLEERLTAGAQWRETGLVFTMASGGFLEPRNINRTFHSLCARADVPLLRVHDLRHSCATLLFTMGVPPPTVQRILRHSSITVTTGTYVEVIEAVQRDALDSMSILFEQVGDDSSGRLSSRLSSNARESDWQNRPIPGGANGTRTRDPHTARVKRGVLARIPASTTCRIVHVGRRFPCSCLLRVCL